MSKWWVLVSFENVSDANTFTDSVIVAGGVEAAVGGGWERLRATIELGPHRDEGQP